MGSGADVSNTMAGQPMWAIARTRPGWSIGRKRGGMAPGGETWIDHGTRRPDHPVGEGLQALLRKRCAHRHRTGGA